MKDIEIFHNFAGKVIFSLRGLLVSNCRSLKYVMRTDFRKVRVHLQQVSFCVFANFQAIPTHQNLKKKYCALLQLLIG